MAKQYSIGAVGFWKDGKPLDVMGDERVRLLRAAYKRELPAVYELRADWYHQNARLNWDDVRWDTAGNSVTG